VLRRLNISNFALVKHAELEFSPGLNVITGESGSGKSLLVDALELLIGQRARHTNTSGLKCIIEGHFDSHPELKALIKHIHVDDFGQQLIIRREINDGKSRTFVNDTPVVLGDLKRVGALLLDLHHQDDTADLWDTDFQMQWLDGFLNTPTTRLRYNEAFALYEKAIHDINTYNQAIEKRAREEDYIQFQLNEMNAINLKPGSYALWMEELKRLENAERFSSQLQFCQEALQTGEHNIQDQLKGAQKQLQDVSVDGAKELVNRLHQVRLEITDIAHELDSLGAQYNQNPARLAELQELIYKLQKLMKKHGISDEPAYHTLWQSYLDFNEETQRLQHACATATQIKSKQFEILQTLGLSLRTARHKLAAELEPIVEQELKKLGMPSAVFKLEFTALDAPAAQGLDRLNICFSANRGQPPRPVAQVASGGERARLMLALKAQRAAHQSNTTLIFDEIDAGVSGAIADRLGRKLLQLGKHVQVISISHLPQIASKGQQHLKIYKTEHENTTETHVKILNPTERIQEIASMLSNGEITQKALENAAQLLQEHY